MPFAPSIRSSAPGLLAATLFVLLAPAFAFIGCATAAWVEIPPRPQSGARWDPNIPNVRAVVSEAVHAVMNRSENLPGRLTLVLPEGSNAQTYAAVAAVDPRLDPWIVAGASDPSPAGSAWTGPAAGSLTLASRSDGPALAWALAVALAQSETAEPAYAVAEPVGTEPAQPVQPGSPAAGDESSPARPEGQTTVDETVLESAMSVTEPEQDPAVQDESVAGGSADATDPVRPSSQPPTPGPAEEPENADAQPEARGPVGSPQAGFRAPPPPAGPVLEVRAIRIRPDRAEVDIIRPGLGGRDQLVTVFLRYRLPAGWYTTRLLAWRASPESIDLTPDP